jgi:hypothetical protein
MMVSLNQKEIRLSGKISAGMFQSRARLYKSYPGRKHWQPVNAFSPARQFLAGIIWWDAAET